jgi:beta-phosphoglucomutase-like phosphatase (HAD superfamily)
MFQAVVKVDDTEGGIEAGLHAGCWTVGIAKTVSISLLKILLECTGFDSSCRRRQNSEYHC